MIVGDVLPLDKLFDGIAAQPSAPEYWWVNALLLSTMIPSLLNLMRRRILVARRSGLPAALLRFMPAGKAAPTFDRTWLALVLTFQVFVGAFLGIAARFVLGSASSSTCCRGWASNYWTPLALWRSSICR